MASGTVKQGTKRPVSRRAVIGGLAVAAAGAAVVGTLGMSAADYDAILAEQLRQPAPGSDARELVRLATLAASSHNTQPWRFEIAPGTISIRPDRARRTPVVDPDDHHLYASLGCASENLSLAAMARGASGAVVTDENGIVVETMPGAERSVPLVDAIPLRQCTRATYDGTDVAPALLAGLESTAEAPGVDLVMITDATERDRVLDLLVAGNDLQLDDPAFRRELKSWLRFNAGAAASRRDGLFSAASGNPSLPDWLGPLMYDLTVTKQSEDARLAEQVRSSAGLVVFVAATDDPTGWIAAGRAYQRFALQATLDGLKHAFVNQATEVASVRSELQSLLGIGSRRPSLIVRFGRGPDMPRSLRRPLEDVIVTGNA